MMKEQTIDNALSDMKTLLDKLRDPEQRKKDVEQMKKEVKEEHIASQRKMLETLMEEVKQQKEKGTDNAAILEQNMLALKVTYMLASLHSEEHKINTKLRMNYVVLCLALDDKTDALYTEFLEKLWFESEVDVEKSYLVNLNEYFKNDKIVAFLKAMLECV